MFGFGKNDKANISTKELEALKMLAYDLLSLKEEQIRLAIKDGALVEVSDEKQRKQHS